MNWLDITIGLISGVLVGMTFTFRFLVVPLREAVNLQKDQKEAES